MSMYSISHNSNQNNLEEFVLTVALTENGNERGPGNPILSQDITAVAALEVILHMRQNLQSKIELDGGVVCRLLSTADILIIAKHAMKLLKTVFQTYSNRLKQLSKEQLGEVGKRVAGVYHREDVVNLMTGSGISFTGLTKLYYDSTHLNKVVSAKILAGVGKDVERSIYYVEKSTPNFFSLHPTFPCLKDVEAIVSTVMGPS